MIAAYVALGACTLGMGAVAWFGVWSAIVVRRGRRAEYGDRGGTAWIVEIRACSRWADVDDLPIVGVRTRGGQQVDWIGCGCPTHGDDAECVRMYRLVGRR